MSTLHVSTQRMSGVDVVALEGELDVASVPAAKDAAQMAIDGNTAGLVIDLRQVSFMDSSGLAMLMILERRAAAASRVFAVLAAPAGACRRTLEVSGLDQDLRLIDDLSELAAGG